MKNTVVKMLTLGVATFLGSMTVSVAPSQAANFFFESKPPTPAGAQLDDDPILDILTEPGEILTFDVKFDTTGIVFDPDTVELTFDYTFQYDAAELTPLFDFAALSKTVDVGSGLVNELSFLVNQPGISPHDGISDFGITLINVVERNAFGDAINTIAAADFDAPDKNILNLAGTDFNQVVEVQVDVPEPASLLGLLTIGGLGMSSLLKQKKR